MTEKMKVAAFHGSPRPGGNSELLLREALRAFEGGVHEVVLFRPARMRISPCRGCGKCSKTGACVVRDEMDRIYDAIRGCQRFIVSTPVYFMGLPAQMKAVVDRCQAFWSGKYLLGKKILPGPAGRKGLLLLVGGMKMQKGLSCAAATATAFFRTISVGEHETLSYCRVDSKGSIKRHPAALREAFEAARRLVSL